MQKKRKNAKNVNFRGEKNLEKKFIEKESRIFFKNAKKAKNVKNAKMFFKS